MTCEKCGVVIPVGDWPFCPHGAARPAVHGDEIDYVDHNLGRHPVRITSKAQRRQLMAERGLVERVEHVPTPGSDKSPHTRSWAVVDLEAATALVSRQGAIEPIETPETADRSGVDLAWHVREDVKEWIDHEAVS
jgi:hypothetical protein